MIDRARARSRVLFGASVIAALAIALGSAGCCRFVDDETPRKRQHPLDPTPKTGDVDLGVGIYPAGSPTVDVTRFRFVVPPLKPSYYRAGYELAATERHAVRDDLYRYADSVGYHTDGKDKFKWQPPEGCSNDMHCIFNEVAARNLADIKPLADLFRARAHSANLSSLELAELVVSFVQGIPYQIPKEPFGLLPPALVAAERRGDCDSKSLLTVLILHHLGIEAVMVSSDAHRHAMVGIPLPNSGNTFEYNGRRYAFTEATAPGWPIGKMDPSLVRPNDWQAFAVRFDGSASPAASPRRTRNRRGRR